MKNYKLLGAAFLFTLGFAFVSCSSNEDTSEIGETETETGVSELHAAFAEFDTDETDIYLSSSGTKVTIETTGNPNHETLYWGSGNALYKEESTVKATPSLITGYDGSDVLVVSSSPSLASKTSYTNN
jgi:hypothetical protein